MAIAFVFEHWAKMQRLWQLIKPEHQTVSYMYPTMCGIRKNYNNKKYTTQR